MIPISWGNAPLIKKNDEIHVTFRDYSDAEETVKKNVSYTIVQSKTSVVAYNNGASQGFVLYMKKNSVWLRNMNSPNYYTIFMEILY